MRVQIVLAILGAAIPLVLSVVMALRSVRNSWWPAARLRHAAIDASIRAAEDGLAVQSARLSDLQATSALTIYGNTFHANSGMAVGPYSVNEARSQYLSGIKASISVSDDLTPALAAALASLGQAAAPAVETIDTRPSQRRAIAVSGPVEAPL